MPDNQMKKVQSHEKSKKIKFKSLLKAKTIRFMARRSIYNPTYENFL